MDSMIRRYRAAEKNYRKKPLYRNIGELKASRLSFDDRRNLFRLTSVSERFAFIVNMNALDKRRIFSDPDSKQRYLDWVFKVGLKEVFQKLISQGSIIPGDDVIIRCFIDEHTTATNGLYGLEKSIYQEFHEGTLNYRYSKRFDPILNESQLKVCVKYVNSEVYELVRAADIIANRVLFEITSGDISSLHSDNLLIRFFPMIHMHEIQRCIYRAPVSPQRRKDIIICIRPRGWEIPSARGQQPSKGFRLTAV